MNNEWQSWDNYISPEDLEKIRKKEYIKNLLGSFGEGLIKGAKMGALLFVIKMLIERGDE